MRKEGCLKSSMVSQTAKPEVRKFVTYILVPVSRVPLSGNCKLNSTAVGQCCGGFVDNFYQNGEFNRPISVVWT